MKVLVIPADLAGCGYYRLINAALHLQLQGHDVHIQWPDTGGGIEVKFQGDEIIDVSIPEGADVIVLQRVSHLWHVQSLPILRQKGVAVVIDMDDDLSSIHPKNAAFWNYHRKSNTPFSSKSAEQVCRDATLVTVSTRNLLKIYAKHGRGVVLDNFVPQRYLDINREPDDVFGWAGTTQSHPTDLQACGKSVQTLIDAGYKFRVVGPPSKVQEQLRLKDPVETTGVVDLQNWAYETAQLKVALAPLESSQFNISKSRLKIGEANSVGIPWVASPREEYRRFHRESGGGILAETPKEWVAGVKKLMDDEILRKELGEKGRNYMRSQTVEGNSWRFMEAWTLAYDIQQGRRTTA